MDRVVINNRNFKNPSERILHVEEMLEKNNELVIRLAENECYRINEGQKLSFKRKIYDENGLKRTLQDDVFVKYEDKSHLIHTTLPSTNTFNVEKGDLAFEKVISGNSTYYIVNFKENHNVFAQDLTINTRQWLYFKKYDGTLIDNCSFSSMSAVNVETKAPVTVEDCLYKEEVYDTCGKNCTSGYKERFYAFLPNRLSEKSLIIRGYNEYISSEADYVETKFNPFYYYTTRSNELDAYGNPVKHCKLYQDRWWNVLSRRNEKCATYSNIGDSSAYLSMDTSYININIGLSSDSNEYALGTEDYFSKNFAKMVENSLIPPVIDMERLKYYPIYEGSGGNGHGNAGSGVGVESQTATTSSHTINDRSIPPTSNPYEIVTSITLNFHFRERVTVGPVNDNSVLTKNNLYADGWYIGDEKEPVSYWNGYSGVKDGNFHNTDFTSFMNNKGEKSDLIGYLNFTDDDVHYNKQKVGKSFIRLSFYNSIDPVEQKLLYYSTVFLDSTELNGKFIKQLVLVDTLNKNHETININPITSGNENTQIVFLDDDSYSAKLDTRIVITNEYDRTKSAEGFNIYLFSDDAPLGNSSRTIYMKVEFNHAGNGKTLPLIMWPKEEGLYRSLTVDNFIENLYIPIEIKNLDGKYVYSIPDADYEDGNLKLVLFEPKLFNE